MATLILLEFRFILNHKFNKFFENLVFFFSKAIMETLLGEEQSTGVRAGLFVVVLYFLLFWWAVTLVQLASNGY